jgi:L-iditol 2-dehydrogenase
MIRPPSVFGHEFAGEIVLSENDRFSAGTRVVAANSAPCGRCLFCDAGQPNLCRDLLFLNGAYAEYVLIPSRIADINCLPLPDDLPAYRAALVEPLACTVKGVEAVALKKDERVLIIGAGPVGLMLARLSVLAGAEVTIVDGRPDRLAVACELEVAHTVEGLLTSKLVHTLRADYSTQKFGFDCVIEAIGQPATWSAAVELVRPGGRVNLFGGCPRGAELRVDTSRLHYDEIRIIASFHHTPATVRKALELIATSRVPASALIRQGRALEDLPQVFLEMRSGSAPPKTAILPQLPSGSRLTTEELENFF